MLHALAGKARTRLQQAAQRDQELAHALDNLTEHVDATERYGPALPGPLKQLFWWSTFELLDARSGQSMVRTMRKRAFPAIIFA
jgi:hypothetical protein